MSIIITFAQQNQQVHDQANIAGDMHVSNSVTNNVYQNTTPRQPDADDLKRALSLLEKMPIDAIPDVAPLPAHSQIPYGRNKHFVGREEELQTLAEHLKGGTTVSVSEMRNSQLVAATGLGGIGKTQLAVAFAHRYGQYFAGGVYWMNMTAPNSVMMEVVRCGEQMMGQEFGTGPGFDTLEVPIQVRLVLSLWQSPIPRLLIFDNCEEPALLERWHPPTGGCRVLVTSRRQRWTAAQGIETVALSTLTRAQSIELLLRFRPDLRDNDSDDNSDVDDARDASDASDASDDSSHSRRYPVLNAIAAELGDLPLALHMAGSYLETCRYDMKLSEYLDELRNDDLLDHESLQETESNISPTQHDLHVARTFAISTNKLNSADPVDALAQSLLSRAACFAPNEPIPRTLLLATVDASLKRMQKRKAIGRLSGLGLIDEVEEGALVVHRLVAHFVDTVMGDTQAQDDVAQAMIDEAHELNEHGDPRPLSAWQTHLTSMTEEVGEQQNEQTAHLYMELGHHLGLIGLYQESKSYVEQALSIRQICLGDNHLDTAQSLNNLGVMYSVMGDSKAAKPYHEQALAIRLRLLGDHHPDTAQSLGNLGGVFHAMGDYEGAHPYYQQALAIYEEVLAESHPDTARSLNNLGSLKRAMGDYEEAQPYSEQALAIRLEVLGENHPYTATSLNNLGLLFQEMGDYEGAQPYFEQALAIYEEVLGEKHPDTATSLNNLGGLLNSMGDYEGAQPYFEQALAIRRQVLGESHPDTAGSRNNLGVLLAHLKEYDKAAFHLERALEIRRAKLGHRHPDTRSTRQSLENVRSEMHSQGDTESRPRKKKKRLRRRKPKARQDEKLSHPDEVKGAE
ncbi:MAG: tetratricopeptide repeat protein [Chloroflexota bacterium]